MIISFLYIRLGISIRLMMPIRGSAAASHYCIGMFPLDCLSTKADVVEFVATVVGFNTYTSVSDNLVTIPLLVVTEFREMNYPGTVDEEDEEDDGSSVADNSRSFQCCVAQFPLKTNILDADQIDVGITKQETACDVSIEVLVSQ